MAAHTSAHYTAHGYQPNYPAVQHNYPHASQHPGFYARKHQSKYGQVSAHLRGSHHIQPQLAVAHHSVYPSAVAHYAQPHHKLAHHSVYPSAVAHYPEPQPAVAHYPEPQPAVAHYDVPHHGLAQGRKPQDGAVHHVVHQHTAKLRQPYRSPSAVSYHGPAPSLHGCVNNFGYGVPCRV
eukprot:TRINITY_DN14407_c0_g1_i1.p1 TRINITY_DN14407_c0_g1~~TRINITY_DN14407_c0_g1_i1.p1  ORF type:complete len:198 (-),score=22.47 TRINITY_DN14407_c0_g1_i1:118-654(-)